jgi:hypothetical protein
MSHELRIGLEGAEHEELLRGIVDVEGRDWHDGVIGRGLVGGQNAQRVGNRHRDRCRCVHRRHCAQPDAVGKALTFTQYGPRDLERNAGLADAAGASQRDHTAGSQSISDEPNDVIAADERSAFGW